MPEMQIPDDKRILFAATPFRPSVAWQTGVPDNSAPVSAYSVARGVPYALPFKCRYSNGAWRNALTGDKLAIEVRGWR
jgi:hypothetical protein